ncbi:MAG: hypothetical protein IPK13_02225 [Deltaproteobacteria bacterium]|nr:hypothetical protein [Deltaproteobacteria bacterium]
MAGYSYNPLVAEYASLHGMHVGATTDGGLGTANAELARLESIRKFAGAITEFRIRPKKGWILFDDGALGHGVFNDWKPASTEYRPNFSFGFVSPYTAAGIADIRDAIRFGGEQTRRGSIELAGKKVPYPLVHLSDLRSKQLEGKVIASAVAERFRVAW